MFGSISKLSFNNYSSTDHQYITDQCVWCVMAASQSASWKNIFYIFSMKLWIAATFTVITMGLAIYFYLKMTEQTQDLVWTMLCSLLITTGLVSNFEPKTIIGRFVFFLFLFYGILISSLFQSATVSKITSQYYHRQVSSLKEAILNNFEFTGSNYQLKILKKQNTEVIQNNLLLFA